MQNKMDTNHTNGGAPYQNRANGLSGGDFSNGKGSSDVKGAKKVANGGAKQGDPKSVAKSDTGAMKPDFYPGTAINESGPNR